jgi:hypothetical protein
MSNDASCKRFQEKHIVIEIFKGRRGVPAGLFHGLFWPPCRSCLPLQGPHLL